MSAASTPRSLRDVWEAVALAGGSNGIIADTVPQEVWDDLHERGLVATGQDITGDAETYTTSRGCVYVAERMKP